MNVFPNKTPDIFFTSDFHEGMYYSLTPPPLQIWFGFHISCGDLTNGGKNNKGTILGDGSPIVSVGHSVETVCPHLNITWIPAPVLPIDILIPLHIWLSSNTCYFGVSSVIGCDHAPIAVSLIPCVGIGFNQACGVPFLPTSIVHSSGTVVLGFTFGDFCRSLVRFTLSTLLSWALSKLGGLIGKGFAKVFNSLFGRSLLGHGLFRGPGDSLASKTFYRLTQAIGLGSHKGFTSPSARIWESIAGRGVNYVDKGLGGFIDDGADSASGSLIIDISESF